MCLKNFLWVTLFGVGALAGSNLSHADSWDPGDDTSSGATQLITPSLIIQMHGPHVLSVITDEYDWFKVSLTTGVSYVFESTGNSDMDCTVYSDPPGTPLFSESGGGVDENFRFTHTPLSAGNLYLRVSEWDFGDAEYSLNYYRVDDDLDDDGMADSWEEDYFVAGTNTLPNANSDLDQFTNLEEYIAGTDPTNAASFFAVTNNLSGGCFVVQWSSVSAREYKVLWAESLTNSFTQQGLLIDHPQNSYTDTTHNAESSGFYKVEVQLK